MIGKQIGRYRLTEEIGRGGMGIVYKATQITLNRTVAVKMLPHDLAAHGEYLARFTREAQTLASLQHPNIVHIYDVEEAEGSHFIIMEYVGGPSLTRRLQVHGRLDPREVRSLAIDLSGALEAAHRKGIIHRDIKPDNILFSEDGTPKLTDFGIARMRDSNVKTQTGVMLGTPFYMSPEQVSGAPITGASDVYSLGVVMYETLSGRVPFNADTPVAVALKHLQETATPLTGLVPSVPLDLGRIVDRAMAKESSARFGSAKEMRRALRDLSLGKAPPRAPITTCPQCGTSLQRGFRACPKCALSLEGLGEIGAPVPPSAGGEPSAGRDAAELARGAANIARDAADAGLDALSAAGGALADSAGDAWAAVARSADAVWSAVSPTQGKGEAHDTDAAAVPEAGASASGGRVPAIPAPHGPGGSPLDVAAWRTRLRGLPPLTWIGLGLVMAGLLLAALLGGSRGSGGRFGEEAILPPPGSGELVNDIAPTSAPSSRVIRRTATDDAGVTDPVAEDGVSSEVDAERADPGTGDADVPAAPEDDEAGAADDAESEEPEDTRKAEVQTPVDIVSEESDPEEPVEPTTGVDGLDEAAARRDIEGIVERQRRATESNDEALYLLDLDRSARSADGRQDRDDARRGLHDLHEDFTEIRSQIANVRISFSDRNHATLRYEARISGIPKKSETRQTLVSGEFTWRLEFLRGRWMIVTF